MARKKAKTARESVAIPPHFEGLLSNVDEVLDLIVFHQRLTGAGPGRRRQVEVLNKSAIVLLVACWEAFVEDLATDAFDYLLQYGHDHTVFPPKLLALATKDVRASQDARAVWRLAGDGWREVLQAHRQVALAELVGKVNTPRPTQVDAMFRKPTGSTDLL